MTKKLFTLLLAVAASVGTMFASTKIGNLYYNLDATNHTAEVTSSIDKYSGAIVIPSSVTKSGITYSVTSIGDRAFNKCTGLTSVTIGNSVTSIGEWAFRSCSSLNSVTIGNSVTSIGDQAFYYCTGLTSVTWNAKNCADNTAPFNNISSQITSFTFGNKVEHIPANLCNGMSKLTSVTIPNSVTSIGNQAFRSCSGLTSVTIPNSVTSIGQEAFYYCTGLTSPVYNAHVFAYMPTSYSGAYTIPDGIESIAGSAFSWCHVSSVTIPNSVTSIGKYAFSHCTGLTSVTIGNSVTSIGFGAFLDCSSLTSVTIGNSVTSIGDQAFYKCTGLTSVTIPNSVTSIGFMAFEDCTSLTSVEIPNSVTSIGGEAFYKCTGLTSVTIPNSVTSIGRNAFERCSGLTSVTIEAETPPTLDNKAFDNTNNCPIYVPCGTLDAYKTAWSKYASRMGYVPFVFVVTGLVTETMMGRVVVPTTLCDDTLITAVPNYGYHFTQWSDGVTDNPRTIVLTSDTTFTAEFAKNTYTISTASSNPEWGTTAGDTTALYLDEVEISATSNYGYHFVRWSDNNTQNPRTYTITADATLTAIFAKNIYNITKNAEHGTISGNSSAKYLDEVTLTVNPDYGYHFTQWSDGVTDNPRSFILTQDTAFTAEFEKNTYTLSLTTNNPAMGQVEGAGVYGYNTQVNCVAVPYDGYEFVSWDNGIKDNPYILTITEDITLIAMFQPIGEGLFDTKEQASSPRKVLENGQLFILRGEKIYTLTGQEVK